MRSLAIQRYCTPVDYDVLNVPQPQIEAPDDILIKVYAASINPVDVKVASGVAKMVQPETFPYKIGYDLSGIVVSVGPDASSRFKPGDEVYARVPERCRGTISDFALSTASATALKPKLLSHTHAGSLPLVSLTALQALDAADAELEGGLKGKTVFIPDGLSGVGTVAIQLAKNVFGASKVITTLSPSKIAKVDEILGKGIVDQVIDYTKQEPAQTLPKGSVDSMFDTMGGAMGCLRAMKEGGVIVTVAALPFGPDMERVMSNAPVVARWALNAIGFAAQYRASRYKVKYSYLFTHERGSDLKRLGNWLDQGKVVPVVCRVSSLTDLQGVRDGCQEVLAAKGGIGKFVIEIQ
ncbi:hypothetical protein W97_05096 [Coniosporium apollinis CBS 100218]|uniref:Enoyl reductase (ER) domain-containing protein n=1 Tax=Coniosporium apollinis (strain CBS 100218) TaxID=1168221 RepID=R7YVL3_CONA1|nr:uncharacterized protein W97_05096 [Coniosporium apollinis CBS 100218]EON65854.1 hypothetical protein W97_05096 [Coniosporium apollinis CBS 100218]